MPTLFLITGDHRSFPTLHSQRQAVYRAFRGCAQEGVAQADLPKICLLSLPEQSVAVQGKDRLHSVLRRQEGFHHRFRALRVLQRKVRNHLLKDIEVAYLEEKTKEMVLK